MRARPADFMIVDLMLGEMDGFSCIREVRRFSDVPIVVVSARSDTHDVVAGLEAGADDYVTKPFHVKEITARLRALRRRLRPQRDDLPGQAPAVVLDPQDGGHLVFRPTEGRLHRDGEEVHLTLTEFRLLNELVEARGQVLSRRQVAGAGLGARLLRRRAPGRRPRPPVADQDRSRSGPAPDRGHGPRSRLPPRGDLSRAGAADGTADRSGPAGPGPCAAGSSWPSPRVVSASAWPSR